MEVRKEKYTDCADASHLLFPSTGTGIWACQSGAALALALSTHSITPLSYALHHPHPPPSNPSRRPITNYLQGLCPLARLPALFPFSPSPPFPLPIPTAPAS